MVDGPSLDNRCWARCALKVVLMTSGLVDGCRLECAELVELDLDLAGILLVKEVTGSSWTFISD